MKNFIVIISVFLICSLALVSCSGRKPLPPVMIEKTKTITKVVKDTIYKIEADSSFYNAYVECVNGKPLLITKENQGPFYDHVRQEKLPKSKPGKYLDIPKVKLKNGLLTVNCEKQAQDLFKQWRETYIQSQEKQTVIQYVEKPFKWYHKTLMWLGGIFMSLSIVALVLKFKS